MKTVIFILCFILALFPNPIELILPHEDGTVRQDPIQIHNIYYYESFITPGRTVNLVRNHGLVGIDENHEYVIGLFLLGRLVPFMARRADLDNQYGRVKILINGDIAKEIVPMVFEDPENSVFGKEGQPRNIRPAEFH